MLVPTFRPVSRAGRRPDVPHAAAPVASAPRAYATVLNPRAGDDRRDADIHGAPVSSGSLAMCAMPASCQTVPALRRFTRHTAERWGVPDDTTYALCVVVSELVANAVLHSGSPDVELSLRVHGWTVIVQVKDSGVWEPYRRPDGLRTDGEEVYGRGLRIVRTYTTRCLVSTSERGTKVRAEMDLSAPVASTADPDLSFLSDETS